MSGRMKSWDNGIEMNRVGRATEKVVNKKLELETKKYPEKQHN